ncbi:MAG: parB-like partition protein [Halanaerobium sp.]|jgi:ParB/RepB/Spo0J family partition protein|nr:MAG: parB-like partition protein [Halanaerobium sp.]
MIRIDRVPIDKIKKNPALYPEGFDRGGWERLARSISQVSILEMVILLEMVDGYLQLSGEKRIKANRKTGKTVIPAIVVDDAELTPDKIEIIKNLQPDDIDPLERAIILNSYIEEEGLTKRDASKKLGIARTTITLWLIILEYEDKYQQAIIDNFNNKNGAKLTLSHLDLAKSLDSTVDHKTATKFLDAIMKYNLTRKESIDMKKLIQKYPKLNIEEVSEMIINRKLLEDDLAKSGDLGEEFKEIMESFDTINEKIEVIREAQTRVNEEKGQKLLKEILFTEQKLQQISVETFGKTLKETKEELL